MKIASVVGARPQFIKAAALSRAISSPHILIHTGQHYDANMSDIFFQEMAIPTPNYHLGIGGCSHGAMTGRIMESLEQVFVKEKPDHVVVYGDTNSTLAAALVAAKLHIPISHVEAGLRSFNKKMPEEINRILTDHCSQFLFAPTQEAVGNLRNEGITKGVHLVGDIMYDTTLFYKAKMRKPEKLKLEGDFYLCTIHRQENTDDPIILKSIFAALQEISSQTQIIFPIHPRTKKALPNTNIPGITFINPVGYFEMLYLLDHCKGVLTDSGGLQKESYFFGKPLLILREETEWVELVQHKVAQIVGSDYQRILKGFSHLHNQIQFPSNLYGDGTASQKIEKILNS